VPDSPLRKPFFSRLVFVGVTDLPPPPETSRRREVLIRNHVSHSGEMIVMTFGSFRHAERRRTSILTNPSR
jgi:hypothetical protein